ncbi:Ankyrin repeat protein 1 [Giardia muris]|uniref:Ankyrin repeat protein 1 n=1 Tax=Giardia muris TaxID=5742 RepID=A0A4Z1STG1_GIAMU|nr:Ankyrin repeat protein 1 [Giardia muris]|eukprot:TNJ29212.1 Ankyrin repeat protein 1 [Giardia muris]
MISNEEEWFAAVIAGHHRDVSKALGRFQRCRNPGGLTALMLAARNNDVEMVRLLIEHEKALTDAQGYTALVHAALAGSPDACIELAPHEFAQTPEFGHTPLTLAAADGVLASVRALGLGYRHIPDANGLTAIEHAADNGHLEVLEALTADLPGIITAVGRALRLADRGSDIAAYLESLLMAVKSVPVRRPTTQTDEPIPQLRETTQLEPPPSPGPFRTLSPSRKRRYLACGEADRQRLKMSWKATEAIFLERMELIAARQRMTKVYMQLCSTVERVAEEFFAGSIKEYVETKEVYAGPLEDLHGTTLLMIAAQKNDVELVRHLLDTQAGRKNIYGMTALMFASRRGATDCIRLLLPTEANNVDDNGYTALMHASLMNEPISARILATVEAGRKLPTGETALILAAQLNHRLAFDNLVSSEAKNQDSRGATALIYAVYSPELFEYNTGLASLEVGYCDSHGSTALMNAVYCQNNVALHQLKTKEMRMRMENGMTSLMIAACIGATSRVDQLAEESMCTDSNGFCALHYAAALGATDSARRLALTELSILTATGQSALDIADASVTSVLTPLVRGLQVQ